jgi:hypothetical protein
VLFPFRGSHERATEEVESGKKKEGSNTEGTEFAEDTERAVSTTTGSPTWPVRARDREQEERTVSEE